MDEPVFMLRANPEPSWEIQLTPRGDVTVTLRNDEGEVTDQYELTAMQMCRALKLLAEAALLAAERE